MSETMSVGGGRFSGSTLKFFACLCMLSDHLAAGLMGPLLLPQGVAFGSIPHYLAVGDRTALLYLLMRFIGRLAFPIFAFFVAEGFLHTHSVARYLARMLAFAFISEVPFDLAFYGSKLEFTHQNVYFTLFFGLLSIMLFKRIGEERRFLQLCALLGCAAAALLLNTDYLSTGVLVVALFYRFRTRELARNLSTGLVLLCAYPLAECTAPLAFIPLHFYNGKRGRFPAAFFYGFYPVHLLIIWLLRTLLLR